MWAAGEEGGEAGKGKGKGMGKEKKSLVIIWLRMIVS